MAVRPIRILVSFLGLQATGMDMFLKGEHSNMTGSFKERGEQTRNGEGERGEEGRKRETLPAGALRMCKHVTCPA